MLTLLAMLAQLVAPGVGSAAAPADSSRAPAAGPAPALAERPSIEDRHWADLVRACSVNARHVRFSTGERAYEPADFEPETGGIRFRTYQSSRRITQDIWSPEDETFLAWNEITKVEVRNVSSVSEGAATGGLIGVAVGLPVALAVSLAAAIGSIFTLHSQDSKAGGIVLAAVSAGVLLGAAAGYHPHGGWVTCCERDTTAASGPSAALTH